MSREARRRCLSAVSRRPIKDRIDITQLISESISTHRNNPSLTQHPLFSISNFLPRFHPPATKHAPNDLLTSRASSWLAQRLRESSASLALFPLDISLFCVSACFPTSIVYMRFVVSLVFLAIYPPRRDVSYTTAFLAFIGGESSLIPYSLVVSLSRLAWPGLAVVPTPTSCWGSEGIKTRCGWSFWFGRVLAAGRRMKSCWVESDRAQEAWNFRVFFSFCCLVMWF